MSPYTLAERIGSEGWLDGKQEEVATRRVIYTAAPSWAAYLEAPILHDQPSRGDCLRSGNEAASSLEVRDHKFEECREV